MLYCDIKFLQSIPDEPGTNRCSKNRVSMFDEAGNTIRIYHEKKTHPEDRPLASRGLQSDNKR